jgi:hypothetical protein
MRTDNPNNYLEAIEKALEENKRNTKQAYRTFDNFWKDFAFGLKDFPNIGEAYQTYCKGRLRKIWDA